MPPGMLRLSHKINCWLGRDAGAMFQAKNLDELEKIKVWASSIAISDPVESYGRNLIRSDLPSR